MKLKNYDLKLIRLFVVVIFGFAYQNSYSQKLTEDISLSKKIDETSGLEIVDGQFITHNDSGGDPKLYYLDKKGKIVFERTLDGVKNNDWEDITKDDQFIYVANMGNNFDTRKNLSIVKPNEKPINIPTTNSVTILHPILAFLCSKFLTFSVFSLRASFILLLKLSMLLEILLILSKI